MSTQTTDPDSTGVTRGRWFGATATVLVLGAAWMLAACSSSSPASSGAAGTPGDATTSTTLPAAVVQATIDDGATEVPVDASIGVSVDHGTIDTIELISHAAEPFTHDPGRGLLNDTATGWLSPSDFAPSSPYRIEATVTGADGVTAEHTWDFTTGAPLVEVHTSLNVGDGFRYGVGMPIIVTLNTPVDPALHTAVTDRLTVTTADQIEGAWRWFTDTEVHWRPKEFWPAHTEVHLEVDFAGLHLGEGIWGVDGRTVDFSIGDAHISTVDPAKHRMVVTVNGEEVADMPMSAGNDKYPTRSGIHVVNEKAPEIVMDSSTVGIPRDDPDGYYLDVDWAVRISNSGEFVHSAPWSTASQGNANVSHGCVNLAPDEAKWFYDLTMTGDVVIVKNTPNQLEPWNGYGDWQIPWSEWVN